MPDHKEPRVSPLAVVDLVVDHIGEHAIDGRAHHFQRWRQALVLLRELRVQHGELAYGFGARDRRIDRKSVV